MNGLIIMNWVAFVLLAIGGLNWGLVGIFGFNLVTFLTGGIGALASIIYILVFISAIWLCLSIFLGKGLWFFDRERK